MNTHLVFLETAGNQRYIFETNKLRENVGASQLTWLAGTSWVLDAVKNVGGPELWTSETNGLRRALLDTQRNLPIEREGSRVEVVLATSGKALLLVRDLDVGRKIVTAVTTRAAREAPGLELTGVISDAFEWGNGLPSANAEVHEKHEQVRAKLPPVEARHLRLPPVAECASSSLPAAGWRKEGPSSRLASAVSMAKLDAAKTGLERIKKVAAGRNVRVLSTEELEGSLAAHWVAVVHADGNGLGAIFQDFARYAGTNDDRAYADKLRGFSLAIDECGEKALRHATTEVAVPTRRRNRTLATVVPLVFGGDDLTVICDGFIARQL